jgi:predicted nucleic-acid-binding Zn-ribbon protein
MAETENNPGKTQDPGPGTQEEARTRAHEYLKRWPKSEEMQCPVCGEHDWAISDIAILPSRADLGELSFPGGGSKVYPIVPVHCTTCGYVYFINEKWVRYGGEPPDEETQGEGQ